MERTWIDTHIHVSDIGPDGERRERMLEDLLEVLDRCDADLRFVISCDAPHLRAMISDPAKIFEGNRSIHELVRRAPSRLYGSCTINPHFLDESLRVMDICFGEWGFIQLGEMVQYIMDYRMDSDAVEKVMRAAVRYDVPVQVHLGTYWHKDFKGSAGDGSGQMQDLLRAADRVPEAKIILAHAIGVGPSPQFVPWADWFLDVLAAVFDEYPRNFWMEIRDFQSPALARVLREVPTDRILAGTDWTTRVGPPFQSYGTMFNVSEAENPFPPCVGSMVQFLQEAGASEADIARIAFENAKNLFGIDER
ncbi:MAG: amidohydrolase family protein [Kiritimatiellae bacterium]|nr:amidohydrolase family protein [Kiritimatiellia bacterium]